MIRHTVRDSVGMRPVTKATPSMIAKTSKSAPNHIAQIIAAQPEEAEHRAAPTERTRPKEV